MEKSFDVVEKDFLDAALESLLHRSWSAPQTPFHGIVGGFMHCAVFRSTTSFGSQAGRALGRLGG